VFRRERWESSLKVAIFGLKCCARGSNGIGWTVQRGRPEASGRGRCMQREQPGASGRGRCMQRRQPGGVRAGSLHETRAVWRVRAGSLHATGEVWRVQAGLLHATGAAWRVWVGSLHATGVARCIRAGSLHATRPRGRKSAPLFHATGVGYFVRGALRRAETEPSRCREVGCLCRSGRFSRCAIARVPPGRAGASRVGDARIPRWLRIADCPGAGPTRGAVSIGRR